MPTPEPASSPCQAPPGYWGEEASGWADCIRFAKRMAELNEEQRLHFYEVLAHNLTVSIRSVWSDESISDGEKVERIKWINEILHSATAKVWVLRLKTHEWTDEDFGSLIQDYADRHQGIKKEVHWAVYSSHRAVTGEDKK